MITQARSLVSYNIPAFGEQVAGKYKVSSKHTSPLPDTNDPFKCKVILPTIAGSRPVEVELRRHVNGFGPDSFHVYADLGDGLKHMLDYHMTDRFKVMPNGDFLRSYWLQTAVGVALYHLVERYTPKTRLSAWIAKWEYALRYKTVDFWSF